MERILRTSFVEVRIIYAYPPFSVPFLHHNNISGPFRVMNFLNESYLEEVFHLIVDDLVSFWSKSPLSLLHMFYYRISWYLVTCNFWIYYGMSLCDHAKTSWFLLNTEMRYAFSSENNSVLTCTCYHLEGDATKTFVAICCCKALLTSNFTYWWDFKSISSMVLKFFLTIYFPYFVFRFTALAKAVVVTSIQLSLLGSSLEWNRRGSLWPFNFPPFLG